MEGFVELRHANHHTTLTYNMHVPDDEVSPVMLLFQMYCICSFRSNNSYLKITSKK